MSEEPFNIWGTWHSTLKSGSKDPGMTGDILSFKDRSLHLLFKLILIFALLSYYVLAKHYLENAGNGKNR